MRYAFSAALTALLVAGCGDSTGPRFSTYTLESINGQPLPVALQDGSTGGTTLDIVAGGFEFHGPGDIKEWRQLECRDEQAPNGSCKVEGDGVIRREMIFNALENRLYYDAGAWYPMRIDADSATIEFGPAFELHHRYVR